MMHLQYYLSARRVLALIRGEEQITMVCRSSVPYPAALPPHWPFPARLARARPIHFSLDN